jgi:hypothetical protein
MAVGTTSTFDATCDQLIKLALINVGAVGIDSDPTANQRIDARQRLNILHKSLDRLGRYLWRTVRVDIAVVAGTGTYPLDPATVDVLDNANFRRTPETSRTIVNLAPNDWWMAIPDRTTQGTPQRMNFANTLTAKSLELYPVPDAAGTIEVQEFRRAADFSTGNETPDFPQKYQDVLLFGLTFMLCAPYGRAAEGKMWGDRFDEAKKDMLNDDNQPAYYQAVPFGGY